jgi:putative DNA primase/helicase
MTTTHEPSDNPVSSDTLVPEVQTTPAEEMPVAETLPVTDASAQENTADTQTADASVQHTSSAAEITPEVAPEPHNDDVTGAMADTAQPVVEHTPATEDTPPEQPAEPGVTEEPERLATPSFSDEEAPVQHYTEETVADEEPVATQQTENGFRAAFGGNSDNLPPEPDKLDLDKLVQGLVRAQEGQSWVYSLDNERAFIHHINRGQFVMASPQASQNDRMVLAALLAARADADQFRRGGLEITGSAAFQDNVIRLIVEHQLDVKLINPAQREALEKQQRAHAAVSDTLTVSPTPDNAGQAAPTSPVPDIPADTATSQPAQAQSKTPATAEATDKPRVKKEWASPRTGQLLEHGPARYQFSPKNNDSYYARLLTQDGEKTYWGKELQQAINDSGVKKGDIVTLQFLGKQPVSINAPVRDATGNITGYEKIDTERNQWAVQPAIDRKRLVASTTDVTPPASLSVYDASRFWALQQQLAQTAGLTLSDVPAQSQGLLWLGQDGKGQPAPTSAPENVVVPDVSRSAGSVVMEARDADNNLMMHLVKAHGDYLQGVVKQDNAWQHVLGKICNRQDGSTFVALNTVAPDGRLSTLGHGNAINQVKGGTVHFDTFAFALNDNSKVLASLSNPQNMPHRLHEKLGFTQRYTPPVTETPAEKPAHRPSSQHTMQPG